jgi:TDG/mug DNA glycosylase family protein
MIVPWKPTAEQLADAYGKTLPDIIATDLYVLFCGINPSLYTAAISCHFGRPGNRFWPALAAGGITPHVYSPFEGHRLLELGYGVTNMVARATATAQELDSAEYVEGGRALVAKLDQYRPKIIAFLGIGSYRAAFRRPKAEIGPQVERIAESRVWVLPNPSGLNAHFQLKDLGQLFAQLREDACGTHPK